MVKKELNLLYYLNCKKIRENIEMFEVVFYIYLLYIVEKRIILS